MEEDNKRIRSEIGSASTNYSSSKKTTGSGKRRLEILSSFVDTKKVQCMTRPAKKFRQRNFHFLRIVFVELEAPCPAKRSKSY